MSTVSVRAFLAIAVLLLPSTARAEAEPDWAIFGAGFSTGWRPSVDLLVKAHKSDDLIVGIRTRIGDSLFGEDVQLDYALGRGSVRIAGKLTLRFRIDLLAGGVVAAFSTDPGPYNGVAGLAFVGGAIHVYLPRRFMLDVGLRASYVPDATSPFLQARAETSLQIQHHRVTETFASIAYGAPTPF